jgi:PAS domain S-box-containing protein
MHLPIAPTPVVPAKSAVEAERDALAAHLQLALGAAGMGWWHYDPVTRLATFDERYQEIFGVTGRQRPNDEILKLLHPEDLPRVWAAVEAALDPLHPTPYSIEYRVNHPDGETRWVEARGLAAFEGEGAARRATSFAGTVLDVTARKRAEAELRESTTLLLAISDSSRDVIYAKDSAGKLRFTNPASLALIGKPLEEVLGKTDAELIGDADAARQVMENDRRIMASGVAEDVEEMVPLPDGTPRIWASRKTPYRDQHGNIVGLLGISRDVTERANAAKALLRSEERFRRLVEVSSQTVWVTNARGEAIEDSPSWRAYTARSYEQWAGWKWLDAVHPDDRDRLAAAWRKSVETRGVYHVEFRQLHASGEYRDIECRAVPLLGEHGEVREWIGMNVDITGRRRAEEALRESEARYRTMGETLPYGVWRCNADGGAEYVSQSFLDLLEMTEAEMLEFGWTRRLPPEDVEPMLAKWRRCIETGELWDSEHRVLGPDGKYHHVLTRGLPVRGQDGKITSWVGINLDIDKRKQMEEELREADRRKTEFLGVLSHELRNPLAPIRNSIYLLEHAAPGTPQATRARDVIRRQAEHLTRLVDDLLDVTRISRGKVELHRTRINLRDVLIKTTDDLGSSFEQSGVALRVEHSAKPVWVDADPTRVAQVLGNLLQNAEKFTQTGGVVNVTISARDGAAEVSVRDTGVGIEPAQVERMFEPFAQADRTLARTQGGLGLGLALVKGLVELHGGSVRARSDGVGRGAEFVFTLPLAEAAAAASEERGAAVHAQGRVVLVVEDNADAGETLAAILELEGHQVRVARDGRSGLELARELRPDVVVCDIGLPDLDGYEVARALRRDPAFRSTRLIALSGYAQPEDRRRAREAGFDLHIAKPPDVEELKAAVGE